MAEEESTISIKPEPSYAVANAIRPSRDGNLFEHFVIVGLPSSTDVRKFTKTQSLHQEPKLLCQYPPDKKINIEYLTHFCFPTGIDVTVMEKTKSASGFNEIIFGQLSKVEQTSNSYIFVITGQENLFYGVCVSQLELIETKPMLPEDPSFADDRRSYRTNCDYFAPRCYCLISRFPFFKLHFEVIYSLIARDRLRRVNWAIGVPEEQGDEAILQILEAYYAKPVPTESDSLNFQLPGELRAFKFVCPPGDEDKQLADWGLVTLFQLMPLDHIIILYRALLLEKQVVIVSSNLGILSALVLSLIPILRPYVFQGPFISILPSILHDYLEAPVPFIYGIPHMPEDEQLVARLKEDKLIVYVEKNTIHIPFKLPNLPKQDKLIKELKDHHKLMQSNKKAPNPYTNLSKHGEISEEIIKAFRNHQTWIVEEIVIGNIKREDVEFDFDDKQKVEELIQSIPSSYRDFMSDFLRSQHFCVHTDRLKGQIKNRPPAPVVTPRKGLWDTDFKSHFSKIVSIIGSMPKEEETPPPTPKSGEL